MPLSKYSREAEAVSRRRLLARTVEIAAVLPLAGIVVSDWDRKRTTHQLDLSEAKLNQAELDPRQAAVSQFLSEQIDLSHDLAELSNAYEAAYHKSRTVPSVGLDSEGNPTITYETEYYWDEPRGLPDHTVINNWFNKGNDLGHRSHFLLSEQLVNINKLEEVSIEAKTGNKTSQRIVKGLVYGTGIALLLGYEEIMAYARSNPYGQSFKEECKRGDEKGMGTRRSFMKVGAAILGAVVAGKISSSAHEKLAAGEKNLKGALSKVSSVKKADANRAFEAYFGASFKSLQKRLQWQIDTIHQVTRTGIRNARVKNAFLRVLKNTRAQLDRLNRVLRSESELKALEFICKCGTATRRLKEANSEEDRSMALGEILEGLGVVGVMAAVLIPGEIINNKLAESTGSRESW